jgi:hypothetical protein
VLGILVGVALAAASLADGWWAAQLVAGLGTFVFACLVIHLPRTREKIMRSCIGSQARSGWGVDG